MRTAPRTLTTAALSLALCLATVAPPAARAQHFGGGGPDTTPPAEAHQLDFLLGDWTLVVLPHVSTMVAMVHGQPKLAGSWKAWRSVEGFGIEDEMRVTSPEGDPLAFSHALRVFDRSGQRWRATLLDVYRTRFDTSTGVLAAGELIFTGEERHADDGRFVVARARFGQITRDGFHWQQELSYDHGKTWEEPSLVIEAHRAPAAAARR
jgi:hypothetical protein